MRPAYLLQLEVDRRVSEKSLQTDRGFHQGFCGRRRPRIGCSGGNTLQHSSLRVGTNS
jgi:hypothetical protein